MWCLRLYVCFVFLWIILVFIKFESWFSSKLKIDLIDVVQFTMEMAGSEIVQIPKSYALNMFKDFVPMSVFSETNQGKILDLALSSLECNYFFFLKFLIFIKELVFFS